MTLGLALPACVPPVTRVSGELVWTAAEAAHAPQAPLDEIAVSAGEVVRIESQVPLRVTALVRGGQGVAEVTSTHAPKNGVIILRTTLDTTALRVRHGTVVHVGAPREPEISWFDLERQALAWSRSPLGTPFPPLSAAPRIDLSEIADVDAALAEARRATRDLARADASASAVRALVALRAVRVLEGVRPYPFGRNVEVPFETVGKTLDLEGRSFVEVTAGGSASITIEGPTALAVLSRFVRGTADAVAEIRVREGGRLRGESLAVLRPAAPADEQARRVVVDTPQAENAADPTLATLRRVFVHVPPGSHTYEVQVRGASAWVAAIDSSPYERLEDRLAGAKSQRRFIEEAREACAPPRLEVTCALALALGGEDDGPRYDHAMAASSADARRATAALAAGGPADRAARLESDATTGESAVLSALGRDAAATIDASHRDAWWRGTLRSTAWQTADDGGAPTWFAFMPREAAALACGARAARTGHESAGAREVDASLTTVFADPWRRVRAVRLLAVAPCTSTEPIRVEVDGQPLSAQPGSERAIWHVVVRGETARMRRTDKGPGHVYVLSDDACGGQGSLVQPALPLLEPRALSFPAKTSAPGVEVWFLDGSRPQTFAIASSDGRERLDVVAQPAAGLVAIDERGTRWQRAATVALPPWVLGGAIATGSAAVALRTVARGIKSDLDVEPAPLAVAPDVDAIVAVSRKLIAASTPAAKSAAALERALLLASYGAERAALEDAELAQRHGSASAPSAVAVVARAIRPLPPTLLEVGIGGYGVEPDFDPGTARCAVNPDGPRARVATLDAALRRRSTAAAFDRPLAARAAALANAAPQDPRAASLITLATTSSKWRLVKDVEGGGGRVPRTHDKDVSPIVDAEGRLRARLHAGDPFGARFVSVSPDRPARAFIADVGNAMARLDIVCVPRARAASSGGDRELCPLEVRMGENPVASTIPDDGRATIELPRGRGRGKGAELAVSIARAPGDFVALVRIVFDVQAPGTTLVNGVGWVLDTPHVEYRFLLPPGRPVRLRSAVGIVRIDALAEPGETVEVSATAGGSDMAVPPTGEPKIIPMMAAGDIIVTARGGTATVAIAERIDSESNGPELDASIRAATVRQVDITSARMSANDGAWRDVVERSPRPLTWLQDRLGTVEILTGGVAGTIREGSRSDTAFDAYAFESLSYRRRIESIDLFTLVNGQVRIRDGAPTYAGTATLYESIGAARVRISGTASGFAQEVEGETRYTIRPRAFAEYSARVTSDLFIVPRVGYDGYYTSFADRPLERRNVDDDLYNAFRFNRNSFGFLQGVIWYVPFFNHIVYARARGTYDMTNGGLSSASVRPGTFAIFRAVELALYAEGHYFERTTGARASSGVDFKGGAGVIVHLPFTPGSLELRPSTTAEVRDDGRWQVIAGLSFIGSYRRGVRDYSSLELSFPEETSGGIPWRSAESKGP